MEEQGFVDEETTQDIEAGSKRTRKGTGSPTSKLPQKKPKPRRKLKSIDGCASIPRPERPPFLA